MPEIVINTQSVVVESTSFTESIGSLIERAKAQIGYGNTDTSDWDIVASAAPSRDTDPNERYQFFMGRIFVNPPIGTGA